jgi:hypothetical protein
MSRPLSSAEVRNAWNYASTSLYFFLSRFIVRYLVSPGTPMNEFVALELGSKLNQQRLEFNRLTCGSGVLRKKRPVTWDGRRYELIQVSTFK